MLKIITKTLTIDYEKAVLTISKSGDTTKFKIQDLKEETSAEIEVQNEDLFRDGFGNF